ncbi:MULTISPECIES: SDR family NAD(P)-dependent oxidoreductase [Bradyrhizobium]|uniref:SDR family oxidoreductase n=1 Tax=Bradyrhizobium zhengyangense TaxID=2911009 RepID=A0A9X1UCP4_9BRAD|nr:MULTISPECIES: SDR family oxidoreductase [Bradyrhizobium]MCG2632641.1 SDR family oxidoreductase [Bradyrhizobium zhengyangense]MCG2645402.1 SDR family oxidoreductase [Bradyrhizobium zhengyangense]MCG2672874.1 SDR family oxidoreductase [Bradyrhizobium zhengyangense]MDN4985674.1 SDR family oxidoreductase [Bradyrhizobium sp. WYCCWR 13022]MDT4740875.1 SDR family oxidoreductase [Bradyrhizobium sp. WYCCWR 12699]
MTLNLLDRQNVTDGAPAPAACPSSNKRRTQNAEGKTLVLTGASRGIGHATGKLFSAAGWRIITCSRQPFEGSRCPWEAGLDNHIQAELSDSRALQHAIAEIKERLNGGPLHALINNAGISPKAADGTRLNSLNTPVDTWKSVFHVNLLAPIMFSQGLFHQLTLASGAIVNVTSIAGSRVHPYAGTAYATSKAALSCLTREMAHDYAPYGIRVNAIAPGEIKTDILSPETETNLIPTIPMHRVGTPDEVAKVIFFLCSEAASYVTGAEVPANGGQHV